MSTLRVSNIEAKANASSPTVNEKVKITNSSGNVMLQLDGATAGITTIGINSTGATFTVDSGQNISFVGVVTAASFSGTVNSSGVSTFTNGPVLIGSGTSTGTASQRLQVSGGAYVSGNLGVGISNPNSSLDIQGGQFRIRSSGTFSDPTDNAGVIAYDSISGDFTISARSSGGSTALAFRTSSGGTGGEKARIDASGNFGLGTNNPQIKLDVRQDSSSTTVMAGVRVQNTNITTGSQSGIAFLNYDNYNAKIYSPRSGSSQGDIVFATNNGGGISESNVVERARIDSSGRLGINTTSPSALLHIGGTSNGGAGSTGLSDSSSAAAILLKPFNNSGTALALGSRNTGGHYIQGLYIANPTDSVRDIQINPYGGSVGIGTFADAFGGPPGSSTFVVATTGVERFRITSSGNTYNFTNPQFVSYAGAVGGNLGIVAPFTKTVFVNPSTTSTIATIDMGSNYTAIWGGLATIIFTDNSSPWGVYTWTYQFWGRVAQNSGSFTAGSTLIASGGDLDAASSAPTTPAITFTTSHTTGVMDAKIFVRIQTGGNHSGTVGVIIQGFGNYINVF